MTANKHITPENGKQLTAEAAADAATILGIFRGHTQRMNRVLETLKARLAGRTEHEALYYLPKLKAALKAEGFNPGTLGRIWASTKWAVETGQPLETWATYMGKAGLDAAYEEHKKATRAAHDTGRKASEDKPEIDPEAEMDAAAERIEAAKAVRVNPYDAVIVLLDQLSEDELITLGSSIEARLQGFGVDTEELEEAA